MRNTTPYFSIVVPIQNEEDNLYILYNQIRQSLDKLGKRYEIIFIDDGSFDNSFDCLFNIKQNERNEGGAISHTRVIRFSRNFGQTAAMQAGFDFANGDVIITMDGDLQNDPNDIPILLDKLEEGYDVVCGWRRNRKDKTLTRIIPSRAANWIISMITGIRIHDNGCSLKAYRSSTIKSIRLYSDMHRFIPAMTTLAGARITEIEVNHRPRIQGTTKYGLSRIWKVLLDIITVKMLLHFRYRPMFWFGIFAFISFLIGLLSTIAFIANVLAGQHSIVYPAATLLFWSLCGTLISWGLLTEFILNVERK